MYIYGVTEKVFMKIVSKTVYAINDTIRAVRKVASAPFYYISDRITGNIPPKTFSYVHALEFNNLKFDADTFNQHNKEQLQNKKLMEKISILREKFEEKLKAWKDSKPQEFIDKKREKLERKIQKMHNRLSDKQTREWERIINRDERRELSLNRFI